MMADMEREPATAEQTIEAMLERSRRRTVAFRRSFVQEGRSGAGPLAQFVRGHDERALDLYMLAMAAASHEPWKVHYSAIVWSRALGWGEARAGRVVVSRAWRTLQDRQLVSRERKHRRAEITILREDGSGAAYSHPGESGETGEAKRDRYLRVPVEYWLQGWQRRLDLVSKAVLLIALARQGSFTLPVERAPIWYGISADSVQRGLDRLRREKLLTRTPDLRLDPLSPFPGGLVRVYAYELQAPFDLSRQRSQKEVDLKVVS